MVENIGTSRVYLEDGVSTNIPMHTVSVLKQKATVCPAQISVIVIVFFLWLSGVECEASWHSLAGDKQGPLEGGDPLCRIPLSSHYLTSNSFLLHLFHFGFSPFTYMLISVHKESNVPASNKCIKVSA
jgi:hypothetical protein